jgi:hypothetical protein
MKTKEGAKSFIPFPLIPKAIAIVGFFIFFFPGPVLLLVHLFWNRVPDGSSSTRLLFSAAGFALAVLGGIIPALVIHYRSDN